MRASWSQGEIDALWAEARSETEAAVVEAEAAALEPVEDLTVHVYSQEVHAHEGSG